MCGDSPKQKIEKQNELGAKFPDKRYKTDALDSLRSQEKLKKFIAFTKKEKCHYCVLR